MLKKTRTKNKKITESINYAKRIQTAILPPTKLVKQYLNDSFILYKPKDVVAGDFYWMEPRADLILFAAADCTGHGVPGAMVSVVCSNALNRAVNEFKLLQPNDILFKTRELVIETFSKSEKNVDDGMDIALCAIDSERGRLFFSGANNPLWLIRKTESTPEESADNALEGETHTLYEFKGDKQPIGLYGNLLPFSNREVTLQKGDVIYLFTDGFPDQFGGENGKKFMYKPFKRELLNMCRLDMSMQKTHIENLFSDWKKDLEQVDDVCVIGFKVM